MPVQLASRRSVDLAVAMQIAELQTVLRRQDSNATKARLGNKHARCKVPVMLLQE